MFLGFWDITIRWWIRSFFRGVGFYLVYYCVIEKKLLSRSFFICKGKKVPACRKSDRLHTYERMDELLGLFYGKGYSEFCRTVK